MVFQSGMAPHSSTTNPPPKNSTRLLAPVRNSVKMDPNCWLRSLKLWAFMNAVVLERSSLLKYPICLRLLCHLVGLISRHFRNLQLLKKRMLFSGRLTLVILCTLNFRRIWPKCHGERCLVFMTIYRLGLFRL